MIPFIGRQRERAQLELAWDAARAGRPQHLLLTGEAGIGKTRLVEELVGRARADGARLLMGRAWDVSGAPAYWPWTQAFGALVEDMGAAAIAPLLADVDPGLVRLLPRLRGSLPAPADHDEGGSEATQLRLFDGVALLLRRLGGDRPVLLVLDDLESADLQSLQLLRFVARSRSGGPLMVVGVYRSPVPAAAPAAGALWSIGREPSVDVMNLGGLARAELGALLAAVTGGPPSDAAAAALFARTGGNPLFATEFIRLLGARSADPAWLETAPMPSGVRGIIEQRLAALPEVCRELLATAALVGPEVDLHVLAAVARTPAEALLQRLAPALVPGVLEAVPGRPGRYTFSHPLVRQSLYDDLPPVVRAERHRRVADTLREQGGEEQLDAIARHYVAAVPVGAADLALEFCRRAARRASALAARDEAVRLLQQAVAVLPALDDGPLGCDVLLELGEAQARAGWQDDARATLLRAADRAERLQLPAHLARAALGFGGRFVWARAARGSPEVALIKRALDRLPPGETSLRAALLSRLSGLERDRTAATENAARCRQAVQLARDAGDRGALTQALAALALNELGVGTSESLLAAADELAAASRAAGNPEHELQAHDFRLVARMDQGDGIGAEQELSTCLRLAERLAQPAQRWWVALAAAQQALLRGDLARADLLGWEARRLGQTVQVAESRFCHLIQLHAIRREEDRPAELLGALEEAVHHLPGFALVQVLRIHLWACHAELGCTDQARAFLDRQVHNGFADIQDSVHYRYMLALCSDMAVALGHAPAARGLAERLAGVPQRHLISPQSASAGATTRYRGILAALLGERAQAEAWLAEAVHQNRAAGALVWTLRAELDLARLPGPVAVARRPLGALIQDAESAALIAIAEEARRLAGDDPLPPIAAPPAPPDPALLEPAIAAAGGAAELASDPGFRREGEFWSIRYSGSWLRLRDAKGLRYLAQLLARAGEELPAVQLVGGDGGGTTPVEGDLGPVLDVTARAAFQRRLDELEAEVAEAEGWQDGERLARAQRERQALAHELAAAVGLGGRDRRMGDPAERARQSVTKAIKSAIRRIGREHRELGRHLDATVHTGLFCRYEPDPLHPPAWSIHW
jgi:hypothetical protein